jgi:hypothetical protein
MPCANGPFRVANRKEGGIRPEGRRTVYPEDGDRMRDNHCQGRNASETFQPRIKSPRAGWRQNRAVLLPLFVGPVGINAVYHKLLARLFYFFLR